METPLGRYVSPDDWQTMQQDSILRLLFSVENLGGSFAKSVTLESATGLGEEQVRVLCDRLIAQGLLRRNLNGTYSLTPNGRSDVFERVQAAG